jgi:hypothetical protein
MLGDADVATFGIIKTITQGLRTAALALNLENMLAEIGHRKCLKAYIEDRPNFDKNEEDYNSSEEAFDVAMKIIKQELLNQDVVDRYIFPKPISGKFDLFYMAVTGDSSYFSNAARKMSGKWNPWYIPTLEDYENLLRVYEFDYQSYKLATDKDYRQKIENALMGKVDPDLHARDMIAFFRMVPKSDNTATMSVNFINPDGTGLTEIDDILVLEENSRLSELSWAPDRSKVSFIYCQNAYPQHDDDQKYLHPVLLYIVNADGSFIRKLEIPSTYDITSWSEVDTPVWSPDAQKIAFSFSYKSFKDDYSSRNSKSKRSIYVINSDGTKLKKLADTFPAVTSYKFSWSADGKKSLIQVIQIKVGEFM